MGPWVYLCSGGSAYLWQNRPVFAWVSWIPIAYHWREGKKFGPWKNWSEIDTYTCSARKPTLNKKNISKIEWRKTRMKRLLVPYLGCTMNGKTKLSDRQLATAWQFPDNRQDKNYRLIQLLEAKKHKYIHITCSWHQKTNSPNHEFIVLQNVAL